MTRFQVLERASEIVPRELLTPRLLEGMPRGALELADRGITRLDLIADLR